jgi:type IX secretion system PorP/SprF family membrane protein
MMQKKYIFIFLLLLLSGYRISGQIDTTMIKIGLPYPVYSQYLQNGLLINPAYAGSREVLSFFISGRQQWAGIDGAPRMETVSIHSLLKNDRVGLGLSGQFMQYGDAQYGVSKFTGIYADYAYHLHLGKGRLSLGLKAGLDVASTKFTGAFINTLTDPNDPAFLGSKPFYMYNAGAGVYYYGKKFFLGAAIPSFLTWFGNNSNNKLSPSAFKDFDVDISAGALIEFSEAFKFKPSVFIDYSMQQTKKMRVDMNGNFIIKELVWIGGSWRTSEKVAVGILQFQLNPQMMFGYSYDYPMGSMNTYSKGSHEIVFRYEFSYKVSATNPKYF